jgi:TonB-linked SusC/RagA family outer membrane protein
MLIPERYMLAGILLLYINMNIFAQDQQKNTGKISIVADNVSLRHLIRLIGELTGTSFLYVNGELNESQLVSVNVHNKTLEVVLKELLSSRNIGWIYEDGIVTLYTLTRPPDIIHGTVLNARGQPLAGASVLADEQGKGAVTDVYGNFSLPYIKPGALLSISFTGYNTQKVHSQKRNMIIELSDANKMLDEAVIIGYATTTRRLTISDVTSVKEVDLGYRMVANVMTALQGQVPGLFLQHTSGMTGTEVKVQIRGRTSLESGTQPLFIIDGVPFNPVLSGGLGSRILGENASAFSFINIGDIKQIDVLKDADATALFGSRGANGVISIMTKDAMAGPPQLLVNTSHGVGQVPRQIKLLSSRQYLEMRKEAFVNDKVVPTEDLDPDLMQWDTGRYTNWQQELIGNTASYAHTELSCKGGNDNMQYLFSANHHHETTVFPGTFYNKRVGGHFSITRSTLTKKLRVSMKGTYNTYKMYLPDRDFTSKIDLPPVAPPAYNMDGGLNYSWNNPYIALVGPLFRGSVNSMLNSTVITWRPAPQLEIKLNMGYNGMSGHSRTSRPLLMLAPAQRKNNFGSLSDNIYNSHSWIMDPAVTHKIKGEFGSFEAIIGGTLNMMYERQYLIEASGFRNDKVLENLSYADSIYSSSHTESYRYAGVYTRLSYNWKNKYLFNVNVRRDGSSRFAPGKRYAGYGGISAGWIFSEEPGFKRAMPFMGFGKLRMSYGVTGNDQIGNYQYLDSYSAVGGSYQGETGLMSTALFNNNFSWERTRKLSVGIETNLLNNKIRLNCTYYRYRSDNQVTNDPLPGITGAGSIWANVNAVIGNSGWEFLLTTRNIQLRNFEWTSSFNIAINKDKLLAFPGYKAYVGKPVSLNYVYNAINVDPFSGIYRFADVNGIPARIFPVNTTPSYYGGLQHDLRYKSFCLNILFEFVRQSGLNDNYDPLQMPGTMRNQSPAVLKRWQQPGDRAVVAQRFSQGNNNVRNAYYMLQNSNLRYTDASFIRCNNLMLSWELPSSQLLKAGIKTYQVYVDMQNPFIISRYPGLDPETQTRFAIPLLRVITVGAKLTL